MSKLFLIPLLGFLGAFATPLALRAAAYWRAPATEWWSADRSSAGLLPPAHEDGPALVRVYCAPTVRWRGIFAVHCWIVLKEQGKSYERYDMTAWGDPIRVNGFAPDGRWFGSAPAVVYAADGALAQAMIPRMKEAIAKYPHRKRGDYVAWPGPNSNTFVASVMAAVPDSGATLPPNAIGKDYPIDGKWFGLTPSRTGVRLSLGGYGGFTLAWVEGVEINVLGAVAGFDVRRPALKLPGFGRLGLS